MSTYRQVTIVGVGLIGGSIGLGLKQKKLADRIVGVGRRQSSLERAMAVGAIDEATTEFDQGVQGAEVVVVASPVSAIARQVLQAIEATAEDAVITDAGSTKAVIVSELESGPATDVSRYVGGHPLAGDHRTGPEFARADLLTGRLVVVTPHQTSSPGAIAKVEAFWQNLGARVEKMSPTEHDEALATTSHLPHAVSSALAASTPEKWLKLTATGWEDTTRVAAGDAELWTQIFGQNRTAVVAAIDQFIAELAQLKTNLEREDWDELRKQLDNAKRIRDALGN